MTISRALSSELFTTSDLALAATIALYLPIEAIDKQNPQKVLFLFKRTDQRDEIVESYWRDTITIPPRVFFYQLKQIKARLYEER